MNLDDAQRKRIAEWIAAGLKLSEIQSRMQSELGLKLTYMEARLLVDDLKLVPKDAEHPAPAHELKTQTAVASTPAAAAGETPAPAGQVSVSVDQLTRPGALVSGKVTFSDGQRAGWHLDQAGRLGLAPEKQGYRPAAADLQEFQAALESELARLGMY